MKYRIVPLVLALPLLALAAAFVALLWGEGAFDLGRASTFSMSGQVEGTDQAKWIATVIAGAVGLAALALGLLGWWPARRTVDLRGAADEQIRVPIAALEESAEMDARAVSRVEDADATVRYHKDSITLSMRLTAQPDTEVRPLVEQVADRVMNGLIRRYGVTLAQRPNIEIRYARHRWRRHSKQGDASAG